MKEIEKYQQTPWVAPFTNGYTVHPLKTLIDTKYSDQVEITGNYDGIHASAENTFTITPRVENDYYWSTGYWLDKGDPQLKEVKTVTWSVAAIDQDFEATADETTLQTYTNDGYYIGFRQAYTYLRTKSEEGNSDGYISSGYHYFSSDESVVSVGDTTYYSYFVQLYAHKPGKATIYVTNDGDTYHHPVDMEHARKIEITVVKADPDAYTVKDSLDIEAVFGDPVSVAPQLRGSDGVPLAPMTFKSADPEIAQVDRNTGMVTPGYKIGETTITIVSPENEYFLSKSWTVTVRNELGRGYAITRDDETIVYATLAEAYDNALDGEVVRVSGSFEETAGIVVHKRLTFRGYGSAIVSRASTFTGALFEVSTDGGLTLENISLSGGNTDLGDSVVKVTAGEFTMDDASSIRDGNAPKGGAIFLGEGTLATLSGELSNNAAIQGGAIYVSIGATVDMLDGRIVNNKADEGDGIYLEAGTAVATLDLHAADAQIGDSVYFAYDENYDSGVVNVYGVPIARFTAEFENCAEQANNTAYIKGVDVTAQQLKNMCRVRNAGYTFASAMETMLTLISTDDQIHFVVKSTTGWGNNAKVYADLQEAINSALNNENVVIGVVTQTRNGEIDNNIVEIMQTITIPKGKRITLTSVTRNVSGDQGTDVSWDESKTSVLMRGYSLTSAMIVVENGATLSVENLILDGGALWKGTDDDFMLSAANIKIKDDGARGAGTVVTNNTGLTAHAPVLVNRGTLTLESGATIQNNDNNYALPGLGFGSQNYGGGVRNENGGRFSMRDGSAITDCYSREGGAIMNINRDKASGGASIVIYGGNITGNVSQMKGAAIQTIYGGADTQLQNGEISGNLSLYDLGVLTVEEGGVLTVAGGCIQAEADKNALYLFNQYDEATYLAAPANAKPYIEGEQAGVLKVTGNPSITGKVHLDDPCVAYGTGEKYESVLNAEGYEGAPIALDLNECRPTGKVAVAGQGFDFNATFGVGEAKEFTKLSDFTFVAVQQEGKNVLYACTYAISIEQTEPNKVVLRVTFVGDVFTGANIDGNSAEETDGAFFLDVEFDSAASKAISVVLNRFDETTSTVNITIYAILYDAEREIFTAPEGAMYLSLNGGYVECVGELSLANVAISSDGYAEFLLDGESASRRILVGTHAEMPINNAITLSDLGGDGAENATVTIGGAIEGLQYALRKDDSFATDWATVDGDNVTFEGLESGSEYVVVVRTACSDGNLASPYVVCNINGNMSSFITLTEAEQQYRASFGEGFNALKALSDGGQKPGEAEGFETSTIKSVLAYVGEDAASVLLDLLPSVAEQKQTLEGWLSQAMAADWKVKYSDILEKSEGRAPQWTYEEAEKIYDAIVEFDELDEAVRKVAMSERYKLFNSYIIATCRFIDEERSAAEVDSDIANKYFLAAQTAQTLDEVDLAYQKASNMFSLYATAVMELEVMSETAGFVYAVQMQNVATIIIKLRDKAIAENDKITNLEDALVYGALSMLKMLGQVSVLELLLYQLIAAVDNGVTEQDMMIEYAQTLIDAIDAADNIDPIAEAYAAAPDVLHRGYFMSRLATLLKDVSELEQSEVLENPDLLEALQNATGDDIDALYESAELECEKTIINFELNEISTSFENAHRDMPQSVFELLNDLRFAAHQMQDDIQNVEELRAGRDLALQKFRKQTEVLGLLYEQLKNANKNGVPQDRLLDCANTAIAALETANDLQTIEDIYAAIPNKMLGSYLMAVLETNVEKELAERMASGKYSDTQEAEMRAIASMLVQQSMSVAVEQSAFDELYNEFIAEIDEVHIVNAASGGMDPDGTLSGEDYAEGSDEVWGSVTNDNSMPADVVVDIKKADVDAKAVMDALKAGKFVAAQGSELSEDALKALVQGKDVKGGIDIQLLLDDAQVTEFNGLYRVRILLPADLRGLQGLQVVGLNGDSVEIFQTTVDGNYLEFTTAHFSEFVILGDAPAETANLWWVYVIVAAVVVVAAITVIVVLTKRRKKSNKPAPVNDAR